MKNGTERESLKTEIWNRYKIRFVEVSGEWCAVAKDIANALGYKTTSHMMQNINPQDKDIHEVDTLERKECKNASRN